MTEKQAASTTPTPTESDNFALLVDRTKKVLKKHPNMSVADFVNGYLFPLLDEVRSETNEARDSVEELWDYIGEIPEEPLLDEIERTYLALAGFLDTVLVRAGWLGAAGPNETFPSDMRDQFALLGRKLAEVQSRINEVRSLSAAVTEEEGEDEDTDEDENESINGGAEPDSVTSKPAEA